MWRIDEKFRREGSSKEVNAHFAKGVLFVALGAACYGLLGVLIKKGGLDGFSTGELALAQNSMGFFMLVIMNLVGKATHSTAYGGIPSKDRFRLILGGIPFGLTSSFYYLSLSHTSVSIAIVMLMQSVWIGLIVDYIVNKNKPTPNKLASIVVILMGTVLATNLLFSPNTVNWRGIFWGLMSAISYSGSLYVTNNVAKTYRPLTRSMYILMGAFLTVILVWGYSLLQQFDISVLWKWGLLLGFFGTVLSPLFFTKGMPVVGIALGSILASIELPVSVVMAWVVLDETVSIGQWIGILLILLAVVLMNISYFKPVKSD